MSGTKREEIIYDAEGNVISRNIYPVTDTEQDTGTGTGTPTVPSYTYTPGSTAPTNGSAKDYATWLQGHTKYQAEQTRDKALTNIEMERQRQIVDANTTHRLSQVTYGAHAEKMASMGLTGSGYGEYLTGKAYATQRGDINAANSLAARRKDEVLYQEGQTKLAADTKYAEDLIGIRNQQNTDYTSIYDAAINGASIESIIQDGRWSTLTPEQQTTIRQVTTANSLMSRINAGESLESIKSGAEWNTLTLDQQTRLESLYNTKTETDTTAIEGNYSTWLNAISTGEATLEQVKALSGYEKLTPEMKAALEKAESDYNTNKLTEENEANLAEFESNFATWLNAIKSGAITLDELKNLDAYKKMAADPNGATFITQLETAQANYNENKVTKENEANSAAIEANFEKWLNDINDGSLTLSDIQNLSDFKALAAARPDLLKQLQEAQDAADNKVKQDVKDSVSAGSTLEEIESELGDNPKKEQIIADVKTDVKTNLDKYVKSPTQDENGNIDTSTLDDAYNKGYITLPEYQNYYETLITNTVLKDNDMTVDEVLANETAINALKDEDKLTKEAYYDIISKLFSNVGENLPSTTRRWTNGINYLDRKIEVNGKEYNLTFVSSQKADDNTSRILNSITKNTRTDGKTAKIGDVIYTFIVFPGINAYKTGWYPAKSNPIK